MNSTGFYQDINNNLSIVFIILFYFYWLFFINQSQSQMFFGLILGLLAYKWYNDNKQLTLKRDDNREELLDRIDGVLSKETELWSDMYHFHKTPKKLLYIRKNNDIIEIIYDLRFLEIYDKYNYYKMVAYIEYFLKVHFKLMIDKYEYQLYFDMLKDIRHTILNIMKSFNFNIPNVSRILTINDIDKFVARRLLLVQSITGKYMKILYHKSGNSTTSYKSPIEWDARFENISNAYEMY